MAEWSETWGQLRQHVSRSLLWNLLWRVGVALLLSVAVLGAATMYGIRKEMDELLDARLEGLVTFYGKVSPAVLRALPYERPVGTHEDGALHEIFAVYGQQGDLWSSSTQPPLPLLNDGRQTFHGQKWQVLRRTYIDRHVVVAIPLDVRQHLARDVVGDLVPLFMVVFAVLAVVANWSVWRGLQPLRGFASEVGSRQGDDFHAFSTEVPLEVQPLKTALNHLLMRMSDLRERERRFIADAAHELRAPLQRILAAADSVDTLQPASVQAEILQRAQRHIRVETIRSQRLIEQLLLVARVESAPVETRPMTLADAWHQFTATADSALCAGVQLDVRDVAVLPLNAELLGVAWRNILDNAQLYGAAPVKVVLARQMFAVTDSGSGVSEEVLAHLGERFYRPTEATATGVGIGLSLVKQIAEWHHARVRWYVAPSGGFCVEMWFDGESDAAQVKRERTSEPPPALLRPTPQQRAEEVSVEVESWVAQKSASPLSRGWAWWQRMRERSSHEYDDEVEPVEMREDEKVRERDSSSRDALHAWSWSALKRRATSHRDDERWDEAADDFENVSLTDYGYSREASWSLSEKDDRRRSR